MPTLVYDVPMPRASAREIQGGSACGITSIKAGQPAKDPSRMAAILDGLRLAGLEEG
jgi:hypothetical protein